MSNVEVTQIRAGHKIKTMVNSDHIRFMEEDKREGGTRIYFEKYSMLVDHCYNNSPEMLQLRRGGK